MLGLHGSHIDRQWRDRKPDLNLLSSGFGVWFPLNLGFIVKVQSVATGGRVSGQLNIDRALCLIRWNRDFTDRPTRRQLNGSHDPLPCPALTALQVQHGSARLASDHVELRRRP